MNRPVSLTVWIGAMLVCAVLAARLSLTAAPQAGSQAASPDSWQVPADAAAEKNPVESNPQILRKGLQIYNAKCERCHGSNGKGDGPDGDPKHLPADLTDPERMASNPDGVLFYKIWNGKRNPRMPAFKTDLSKTDVWTVIHFVKTLKE